jgi:hypothetical protein
MQSVPGSRPTSWHAALILASGSTRTEIAVS